MKDQEKRAYLKKIASFLCARYGVDVNGPGLRLQGMNGALDYCGLTFGQVYRVRQSVDGNWSGGVGAGEQLRYVGAYFFPYENGLRLFFEDMDRGKRQVEFSGMAGHSEGVLDTQMAHEVFAADYMEPMSDPDIARMKELQRFAHRVDLVRRGYRLNS